MEHRDEHVDLYADNPHAVGGSLESTQWLLNWEGSANFGFLAHGAFMACPPCTPAYYLYQLIDESEVSFEG